MALKGNREKREEISIMTRGSKVLAIVGGKREGLSYPNVRVLGINEEERGMVLL